MAADIEFRHLRAFVAVADELNFSRAARALHLAQQSLSAQIRQLEHELGVRLFVRTTRHVELTSAGTVLLDHARSMIGQLTTAVERTRSAAEGRAGHATMSYTPSLANGTVPAVLKAVHEHCPDLTLQVREMWQGESVEAVRAGRLDAGLARYPDITDELESVPLLDEPIGIVVAPDHPVAGAPVVRPADLNGSALIIWPRDFSPGFFDHVVDFYRAEGYRGPLHELELLTAGSFLRDPGSRELIRTTRAFSVAFERQFDLPAGEYIWRPVEPPLLIAAHLFWRRDPPPVVRTLVDVVLGAAATEREYLDSLKQK